MNARKIIVDCDPGIDDALALMLLLRSPETEILGITVVCGNVPTSLGAENALKVLSWMGRPDIPVYVGEERPLVRKYVGRKGYPRLRWSGRIFLSPCNLCTSAPGCGALPRGNPDGREKAF